MIEIVSTPQETVNYISSNVYNIKIKCLGGSESNFIPYVPPMVYDGALVIEEHSFSINLIEIITVRCKNEYGKREEKYKADSRYFRHFFNDDVIHELERFEL